MIYRPAKELAVLVKSSQERKILRFFESALLKRLLIIK